MPNETTNIHKVGIMDPDWDPDCDTSMKNFLRNPVRIVALIALVFLLLAILTSCSESHDHAPKPESSSKIGPTADLYTVEHDDHLFVVYSSGSQGGLTHHPKCLERDSR